MNSRINHLGQAVGLDVHDWSGALAPSPETLNGRFCRLEPLQVDRHLDALWEAQTRDPDGRNWTYLSYGPPTGKEAYRELLASQVSTVDPMFFAIVDLRTEKAVGVAAYLRITPSAGVIEIGHLYFSPLLQRTPAATEAIFLLISHAFDSLGYRRVEWKCDSLNAASKKAAERFGFKYEGLFRQAMVSKGRNRDTAWYAIIDGEWVALKAAFQQWLSPENFDVTGKQRQSLSILTAALAGS